MQRNTNREADHLGRLMDAGLGLVASGPTPPPRFIAHADTLERSTPASLAAGMLRHPANRRLTDANSCRRRLGRPMHALPPLTCVGRSFVDTDQKIRDSPGRANCRLPRLRTLEERNPPKTEVCGGGGGVGVGADSRHIWSRSVLGFWPKTVRGFGLHKIQPKVFLARLSAIVNEEVISLLRIRQYSITGRCGLVAKPMPLPRGRQTSLVSLSLLARSFGVSVPTDTDISVLELVFDQPFDAYSNHALTPTFLPLRAKQLPRTCHGSRECRSFHG